MDEFMKKLLVTTLAMLTARHIEREIYPDRTLTVTPSADGSYIISSEH